MEVLRKRGFWLVAGLVAAGLAAVAAYAFPPYPSPLSLMFDVMALAFTLVGGLLMISQMVLPVQTRAERRKAFDHFMNYVTGSAGAVIFVKDGKIVGRKEELRKSGHGVAVVDAVSAIVLERTAARHTWFPTGSTALDAQGKPKGRNEGPPIVRAAGPGVVFIDPGERVAATLDLRRHSRGMQARGLTRDGIEVTAYISVTFELDPDLEPLGQPKAMVERRKPDKRFAYHFNPTSAFYAVYGTALGEKQPVEWTELPLTVAVERFRDVLAERKLDDLFNPTAPGDYRFGDFRERVGDLVKADPVLCERGIVVRGVGVGTPAMPREVVNQRVRSWRANWQKKAIDGLAAIDLQSMRVLKDRQAQAQAEIVDRIKKLMIGTEDAVDRKVLAKMLEKALRRAAANPTRRARLSAATNETLDSLTDSEK